MNNLKELEKASAYDDLLITTRGFAYDSLIYRFKDYQSRAFQMEVVDCKNRYNISELDARMKVQQRHERDLIRFADILNSVMGEHN